MATSEERLRILNMLQEGKINADEADRLLKALKQTNASPRPAMSNRQPRQLRVRITDTETGRNKVNVNIPMGLVSIGLKMGARFIPSDADINIDQLKGAIENGEMGKLVELEDSDSHEKVEVWLE